MTNEERIRGFDKSELVEFLKNFRRICPHPDYADLAAWLESNDEEMIYRGEAIRYQGKAATLVGEKVLMNRIYKIVIQRDGTMVKVPEKI